MLKLFHKIHNEIEKTIKIIIIVIIKQIVSNLNFSLPTL